MKQEYSIGIIGLGVMGANFAQNVADHGFKVVCYDRDASKVESLNHLNRSEILGTKNLSEFLDALILPRAILLLVPAGAPVDMVLQELEQLLQQGDVILDGGNSYFKDTHVRMKRLEEKKILLLGMGISGGEEGARRGPSLMPGGFPEAYERVAPILQAVAACVEGVPCVSFLGHGAAGHFVKMVHNGIEYGLMQLISEAYDVMKRGLGLDNEAIGQVFSQWNRGELASYLLEITSAIFKKIDPLTGKSLVDEILGVAKQKGTGMWTTQSAMDLQVPSPTIDVAVGMRDLSAQASLRQQASKMLARAVRPLKENKESFLLQLQNAFYIAMAAVYAQGMAIIRRGSEKYDFALDLKTVVTIWRGGCIIRAAFLEEIKNAYHRDSALPHLFLDSEIAQKIVSKEEHLRSFLKSSLECAIPLQGFTSVLGYLDSCRSEWLPANLIQAQRDFFGAHTYERKDRKGTFHTEWDK